MTSVALVSKTWLKILMRITCRDIYIPSYPYPAHDRKFTIGRSPIFHKLLPVVSPGQLCQTITLQIPVLLREARYIEGSSIRDMLSTFHGLSLMPNLRSLAVEYFHPTFRGGPSYPGPFCASIVQLHLEYTFESDCHRWLIDGLLANRHSTLKHLPWALPYLEHISTPATEDPTKSIIKVLDRCPHLRLAEERFTIRVHILSSSQLVPENCLIFHGAMPSFNACVVDYHDFGSPKTIRGSAPVLVLNDDRVCGSSIDLSNMFRNVHVFCHGRDAPL